MYSKFNLIVCIIAASVCQSYGQDRQGDFASDVVYHVVQRSFYDSDGDGHGDLAGLNSKLDYLQDLGVTTVLMLPIYPSIYYHNYFPTSFEGVDEEFGTLEDYSHLVRALHDRGMKLIMDVEIHYVTEAHPWWDAVDNPGSEYSDYIIFNGPGNTEPESMIYGLTEYQSYSGETLRIATSNLTDQKVKAYHANLFKYWMDPNGDGDYSDGVDGFRIDHMMDNLDDKDILPNLFADFWSPLLAELHGLNPALIVLAEQADWMLYGESYFREAGIDAAFAFQLSFAIGSGSKSQIEAQLAETSARTPDGHYQFVFLNNHDLDRYASVVDGAPVKLRTGASLMILLYGIPSLYYGEEIGMRGGKHEYSVFDGNDIPRREAMEWYANADGPGMAYWYKDSGPWWDDSEIEPNDGVSVEEQRHKAGSLWRHYQELLHLRASHAAFQRGPTHIIPNDSDQVLTFIRAGESDCFLVAVSLAGASTTAKVDTGAYPENCKPDELTPMPDWPSGGTLTSRIELGPGQLGVWKTSESLK